jgi:zinc transport system substrate-binding protein
MLNKFWFALFLACISSLCLYAADSDLPKIFVSIQPQKYFVDRIAKGIVQTEVLVKPGHSPASYAPSPRQMGRLSESLFFFSIGVPFEKALLPKMRAVCPKVKIVDSTLSIKRRTMLVEQKCEDGCSHSHGAPDPHVWLDPTNAIIISTNIALTLKEKFPDFKEKIQSRLDKLITELNELDVELKNSLKDLSGKTLLVFHPAFGYFADRYGLVQKAIEVQGKDPSPRQMVQIIRQCKKEKVRVIFVQKEFSTTAAKAIADSINGRVISTDHLMEDYFKCLRTMANAFKEGLN